MRKNIKETANRVFITGDTHGSFARIDDFCRKEKTSKDDVLIILGDAGLNFHLNWKDDAAKDAVEEMPISLFCIHGNHEARPATIDSYMATERYDAPGWIEDDHPSIFFAKDGERYSIGGHSFFVIGGAYSVDKPYRLKRHWTWFSDEQPDEETKAYVEQQLSTNGSSEDIILSHTCPAAYMPIDTFIAGVDQSSVDHSTEEWLDKIERENKFNAWYCGHYHINRDLK